MGEGNREIINCGRGWVRQAHFPYLLVKRALRQQKITCSRSLDGFALTSALSLSLSLALALSLLRPPTPIGRVRLCVCMCAKIFALAFAVVIS